MLAVINPVVCGLMVLQLSKSSSKKTTIIAGIKAMLAVLVILVIAALAGNSILNAFGISLDAFKIVGGVILAFIGFQMMSGPKETDVTDGAKTRLSSLVMFAASPGTITMVITLSVVNSADDLPITAIIGAVLAVLITISIMSTMVLMSKPGKSNKRGLVSIFIGLIIVAMGVQFILDGIKQFF